MTAVVTLTPAPVLDRTYVVEDFVQGKVNRASDVYEFMSGKGLNVARTMHLARKPVAAILPIGRDDEHLIFRTPYPQLLRVVPIAGRIRVNINIVEGDGRTTNVNQRAIPISAADWQRVVELTLEQIEDLQAGWLLVSGMHPRVIETGEPIDLTELFEGARARGARIGIDTSGPELGRWARSPLVDLIKPNADELATLVGHDLHSVGEVLEAARELIAGGLDTVLASLGGDGALAISADTAVWAKATAPQVVNTTGAGDAFLAGFLSAATPAEAERDAGTGLLPIDLAAGIALGASWGAHAVSLPTTVLERLEDAPAATVAEPDPAQPLSEPTHLG